MSQFEKDKLIKDAGIVNEVFELFYEEVNNPIFFNFVELQISGNPTFTHYGNRHLSQSETDRLEIEGCIKKETDCMINYELNLSNDLVNVTVNYLYYKDIDVKRVYTNVTNISNKELKIDYISSYLDIGFWKDEFNNTNAYIPYNGWYTEAQWQKLSLPQLGVFAGNGSHSMKDFKMVNTGTWPTKKYLPMIVLENTNTSDFVLYNVESNGTWNIELGDLDRKIYVSTDGGNKEDNGWVKSLKAGESYQTISTVIVKGKSLNELFEKITKYRRKIKIRKNKVEDKVIFNEYMWFDYPFPTEDNTIRYLDSLDKVGIKADYRVLDCGWHDEDGDVFYKSGRWIESKTRFPSGLSNYNKKMNERGIIAGLWIESEIIGALGDAKELYTNDCLFQREGEPVQVSGRYQLDFRNKKVISSINNIFDRLIKTYGAGYLKIDYNVEMRTGTEFNTNNSVSAMEDHSREVIKWLKDFNDKYPNVVLETCASGGNRLDNNTMACSDLISMSDQTMVKNAAKIVANIFTGVLPEQTGIWCYPAAKNNEEITEETVIMNMVNGILAVIQLATDLGTLTSNEQEWYFT